MKRIDIEVEIRTITIDDVSEYCKIAKESILANPSSFYSSPEDYVVDEALIQKVITDLSKEDFRLGAFIDNKIIGLVGFRRNTRLKLRHKGSIFGFFVREKYRSLGIGKQLIQKTITKINSIQGIEKVNLTVMEPSKTALHLYKELGFTVYGSEEQSMKIGNEYVSEILMELIL